MTLHTPTSINLKPLIVGAPFGNYIQPEGTTATLGTFTAANRGGRPAAAWRCLLTLRYYRRLGAWVNKIGLRNPGIDWLVKNVQSGKTDVSDKLISIHGFEAEDWWALLDKVAAIKPMAVELNMSCPNVGHIAWPEELFTRAIATGIPMVVKIPPIRYETMIEQARAAGITYFHCCNTLPNPGGGMSGKPLMGVSLEVIGHLAKRDDFDQLTIIGGGGIYQPEDVDAYADLGVKHVAIATKVCNPKYLFSHKGMKSIQVRATERLG